MKLDFAFFADAAKVADNGLFNVLGGGIDTLRVPGELPATMHSLSLIVRFRSKPEEARKGNKLDVKIVGPHGILVKPNIREEFNTASKESSDHLTTIGLDYQSVLFPLEGDYDFAIQVNGEELGKVRLSVVKAVPDA